VWVVEPGIPTTQDLFGIWGSSRNDIYIVGWDSTILHYDGMKWSMETTTSTVPLQSVHGLPSMMPMQPAQIVFAVGWHGTIIQRNGTGMWTNAAPSSTVTNDLFGLRVASMKSALAVGANGRLMGWNGRAWKIVHLLVPSGFMTGSPSDFIEPLGVLKAVWTDTGDHFFIVGSGGAAYESSGGVSSFDALDTRVPEQLRGLWGLPGSDPVYSVGLNGLILRYSQGQWNKVLDNGADQLPKEFLFGVDGLSDGDITIVGWKGVAIRFQNGMWFEEPTGSTEDLRGVWVDQTTGTAFAVGAGGTVLRRDVPDASTDGGADAGAGD
jgi:hypothetical protein